MNDIFSRNWVAMTRRRASTIIFIIFYLNDTYVGLTTLTYL